MPQILTSLKSFFRIQKIVSGSSNQPQKPARGSSAKRWVRSHFSAGISSASWDNYIQFISEGRSQHAVCGAGRVGVGGCLATASSQFVGDLCGKVGGSGRLNLFVTSHSGDRKQRAETEGMEEEWSGIISGAETRPWDAALQHLTKLFWACSDMMKSRTFMHPLKCQEKNVLLLKNAK